MNPADLFRQDADALQLATEISFSGKAAKRGALIGEMALIDDSPRAANAVAKTPCRLATIDKRRFHFLIQQHPQFATHVMKELADRLRHMNAAAMR